MSAGRPPAPAPHIEGFTFLSPLGSGGFSDVYLYQQARPHRKVAVKVLLADVTLQDARRRFEDEANLMAQLSGHPYIVTIYQAEITADGRSYLAMEYCSRPGLDARYRRGRLGVDEALTLGIQLGSAVETAHRAGIIHRDIKPANVLTTDYNRPALTDFGISGTSGTAAGGLSIPWSAPEAFEGGNPHGVRMDVYSLGATIYTALAGHSPFVRRGGENSQAQLIDRITNSPLEPLSRPDVPASLNQALAVSMAKSPTSRFGSAAELARAFQRIQEELGLAVTPFEVLGDPAGDGGPVDAGGEATRVRSVLSIDSAQVRAAPRIFTTPGQRPDADSAAHPARDSAQQAAQQAARLTAPGSIGQPAADASGAPRAVPRPDQGLGGLDAPEQDAEPSPRGLPKALLAAGIGLVLVVGGAVWASLSTREDPKVQNGPPIASAATDPADPFIGGSVPPVQDFEHRIAGDKVTFTWVNPKPVEGDFYRWAAITATSTGTVEQTAKTSATAGRRAAGPTCIEVKLVRATGAVSAPARYCTEDTDG
ncbi:protein kinase [Paeniglutamicibacter sp. MACA_103]|uniref:serine/threonine-protein kinase n=1 Tax=Paeniglutamicibacter sp. MACA_103 TaxID=3377337 RepID=UPI003895CB1A